MKMLLWFSATSLTLLLKCDERDRIRQEIIGAFVLITGVAAFSSSAYAFYSVSHDLLWTLFAAALWAALIITLDRFLVSSVRAARRPHGTYGVQFWNIIPRIILSIAIGIVIGIPIELYIFRHEIVEELEFDHHNAILNQLHEARVKREEQCEELFAESLSKIDAEVAGWDASIRRTNENRDRSGEGCGKICEGYKKMRAIAFSRQEEEKSRLRICKISPVAPELKGDLVTSENIRYAHVLENREQSKVTAPSLLTQYRKLAELRRFPEIDRASLFVPLLFILFELSPVLAKVLAGVSKYDILATEDLEDANANASNNAVSRTTNFESHSIACQQSLERLGREYEAMKHLMNEVLASFKSHVLDRPLSNLISEDQGSNGSEAEKALAGTIRTIFERLCRILADKNPVQDRDRYEFDRPVRQTPLGPVSLNTEATLQGGNPSQSESPDSPVGATTGSMNTNSSERRSTPGDPESHVRVFIRKSVEAMAGRSPDLLAYVFQSNIGPALAVSGIMLSGLNFGVANITSLFVGAIVAVFLLRIMMRQRSSNILSRQTTPSNA